jgi:hypothetical protein
LGDLVLYQTTKRRTIAFLLGLVIFLGCGSGFRTLARVQSASAMLQSDIYTYKGLSRDAFPAIFAAWLKEEKYKSFVERAEPAFPIPGLGLGYVPQGLTYMEELNCFAVSCYSARAGQGSVIAIVDAETRVRKKTLQLRTPSGLVFYGHAGGLAAWGTHLYLSSDAKVYRLEAEDIVKAADGDTIQFRDFFWAGTNGSNLCVAQGCLWVGEYYAPTPLIRIDQSHRDDASGNRAWANGYALSESNARGVRNFKRSGEKLTPKYVLSIPADVQGMGETADGAFVMSCSRYAKQASTLLQFGSLKEILAGKPARTVTVNGAERPLFVLNAKDAKRHIMPPMSEGITLYNDKLCVLFESAAESYRSRTELTADYVFQFTVEE